MNISVSYLLTEQDILPIIRENRPPLATNITSKLLGAALLILGFFGMAETGGILNPMDIFFMAGGAYFILENDVINYFLAGRRARAMVRRTQDNRTGATLVEATDGAFLVKTDSASGKYPYDVIYETGETEEHFIIKLSKHQLVYMPKRLLDEGQIRELREKLKGVGNKK